MESLVRPMLLSGHDGLVSIGSMLLGIDSEQTSLEVSRTAGIAGAVAGAASMAIGEFVSLDIAGLEVPAMSSATSAVSFLAGSAIPILATWSIKDHASRRNVGFLSTLAALAILGLVSSRMNGASPIRSVLKTTLGGAFAMLVTYLVTRMTIHRTPKNKEISS